MLLTSLFAKRFQRLVTPIHRSFTASFNTSLPSVERSDRKMLLTSLFAKRLQQLVTPTHRSLTARFSSSLHCVERPDRTVVKVGGREASSYLQGILTNDIAHLGHVPSVYAALLNARGKLMHDVIVYNDASVISNSVSDDEYRLFLIEVDTSSVEKLERHLKMYRLRKKIDISICDNQKCWSIFDPNAYSYVDSNTDSIIKNENYNPNSDFDVKEGIEGMVICRDPRTIYLGHKLLLSSKYSAFDVINGLTPSSLDLYRHLRYRLGVLEGPLELPPGDVMPIEANIDYLNGISFHKGCYIGQELTARTHHTLVVRKRYMPIVVESSPAEIPHKTSILNSAGKSVGRLRAYEAGVGVALLKIEESLAAKSLTVQDCAVETFRPKWWPAEEPNAAPGA